MNPVEDDFYSDEGKEQIRQWSQSTPEYSELIQSLKDQLAYQLGQRACEYGVDKRVRCDDDAILQSQACSLGMGTKMLPSNRYSGNRASLAEKG